MTSKSQCPTSCTSLRAQGSQRERSMPCLFGLCVLAALVPPERVSRTIVSRQWELEAVQSCTTRGTIQLPIQIKEELH